MYAVSVSGSGEGALVCKCVRVCVRVCVGELTR